MRVKRVVIGLFGLVFVLVTVVLVVPLFLPKDAIRDELIAQIEARTGWRVRIDGPVGLSLLPGFRMTAGDVGLSGAAAGDGVEFVAAREIDFGLAWEGLFGGDIRITHVALSAPTVQAEIGPDGTPTWSPRRAFPADRWTSATRAIAESNSEASPAPAREETPVASAETAAAEGLDAGSRLLARIGIDRLTIAEGRLVYADRRSGARHEVSDVDMELRLPALAGPLDVEGGLTYRGVPLQVSARVAAPLALGEGGESALTLAITAAGARVETEGTLAPSGTSVLALSLAGDDLEDTLAAFQAQTGRELGPFALTASLTAAPERVEVREFVAQAIGGSIRGGGRVDLDGAEPAITTKLTLADFALESLLGLAGRTERASGTLGGEMRLAARGGDAAALLGTLDATGRITLAGGAVEGLPFAGALAELPGADRLDDIALSLDVNGFDGPVALSGGFVWRDERFTVDGGATPALALAGLPAPVRLSVDSARVRAGYEGTATAAGALAGDVLLETANLRALAAWLGSPLPEGGGLGRFAFSGGLDVTDDAVRFTEAAITLDDMRGRGSGAVRLGSRPRVTATLALDRLGLDPYLGGASGQRSGADAAGGAAGAAPASQGWSTAPIDLSGLRAVDADLSLTAEAIVWDRLEIGRSRLDVALEGGRLSATLAELALYGGGGRGELVLDGSGSVADIAAAFTLEDLSAKPFLTAAADFDWIEGRVATRLDVTTRGASQADLVSGLTGTAGFDFADGAILGLNIPRMVRGLTVDTLLGWASNPAQKTDFSKLAASFRIDKGIASSSDLQLAGPLVRMTGAGRVDMPARTLDWRFEPRVVADLDGNASAADGELAGLGVPVIVRGPWDRPRIYPDIEGILQDPQAALKKLEGLGGGLFKALKGDGGAPDLGTVANEAVERVTGQTGIDVQKVIDGEVDDKQVLDAVEQGFGLPSGFLGSFGIGRRPEAPDSGQ